MKISTKTTVVFLLSATSALAEMPTGSDVRINGAAAYNDLTTMIADVRERIDDAESSVAFLIGSQGYYEQSCPAGSGMAYDRTTEEIGNVLFSELYKNDETKRRIFGYTFDNILDEAKSSFENAGDFTCTNEASIERASKPYTELLGFYIELRLLNGQLYADRQAIYKEMVASIPPSE